MLPSPVDPFLKNSRAMISQLHIIKLNTPDSIAGGATSDYMNRMAPVACDLGTFGSGHLCPAGPTVWLTSPENGVSYPSGSEVPLEAEVSGGEGMVDSVMFLVNDTLVGTDTTAPYTSLWTGTRDGQYLVRAVAVDTAGEQYTSTERSIWLGNRLPLITLTSPGSGAFFFTGEPIPIEAVASDPDGSVREVAFFAGTKELTRDPSPPYEFHWEPSDTGSFALVASVVDNHPDTVFSDTVSVRVFRDYSIGEELVPNAGFTGDGIHWHRANPGEGPDTQIELVAGEGQGFLEVSLAPGSASSAGEVVLRNSFNAALREGISYEMTLDVKCGSTGTLGLELRADNDEVVDEVLPLSDTFNRFSLVAEAGLRGPLAIRLTVPAVSLPLTLDLISLVRGVKPVITLIMEDTLYLDHLAVISADASDPDGNVESVQFFVNDVEAGVDDSDPFGILFTPAGEHEGTIRVRAIATDNDGMIGETAEEAVVLSGLGTEESSLGSQDKKIRVFPNPARGMVIIRGEQGLVIRSVTLLDHQGRILGNLDPAGSERLEIPAICFPESGLYLLRINTGVGVFTRHVMVVR